MRLRKWLAAGLCLAAILALASPSTAQDFRGRINGTVTDNTGAVLPGVTVTATSPALIQPQVQVTSAEGDYRFIALPPGVYDVTFELSGFQTVKREGVRVIINSMNGSIAVRGVKGEVDLHTNNGDVEVTDAVGRIEMGTLSGDVTGTRLRGPVEATTLNGTVALTDVQGPTIAAESTSGSVEVLNAVSSDIELSSVSGSVDFSGPLDPKGRYSFTSHSGTVTLTIPASTSWFTSASTNAGASSSSPPTSAAPPGC